MAIDREKCFFTSAELAVFQQSPNRVVADFHPDNINVLSVDEERSLLGWYMTKIPDQCKLILDLIPPVEVEVVVLPATTQPVVSSPPSTSKRPNSKRTGSKRTASTSIGSKAKRSSIDISSAPASEQERAIQSAITYFKRFYLHWSVMERNPKFLSVICALAAINDKREKVVRLKTIIDHFGFSDYEEKLNCISADEQFWNDYCERCGPCNCVVNCYYERFDRYVIQAANRNRALVTSNIETLRSNGTAFLGRAVQTDAVLLYEASTLALAALQYSLTRVFEIMPFLVTSLNQWNKGTNKNLNDQQLAKQITHIIELTNSEEAFRVANLDDIKKIESKIRKFHDGLRIRQP